MNILILMFLLGFVGVTAPQLAYSAAEDDELSLDDASVPVQAAPSKAKAKWTVGALGLWGYATQGSKSFSTSDQIVRDVSSFTGSSMQAGVYVVDRVASDMSYRFYLSYQKFHFTGTAIQEGVPIAPQSIDLSETLGGAGMEFLYYPWPKTTIWFGGGGDYARGLSLTIMLDGANLPTTSQDLPNYFKLDASAGWDIPLPSRFVVTPFFRVGDILSVKPGILIFEGVVALGYKL